MPYDPNNPFMDPRVHTADNMLRRVALRGLQGLQHEAQGINTLATKATELYNQYAPAPVKEMVNYWQDNPDPIPGVPYDNMAKGVVGGLAAVGPNIEKIWEVIMGSKGLQKIFMPEASKASKTTEDILTHLPVEKAIEIVGQYLDDPKTAANVIKSANARMRDTGTDALQRAASTNVTQAKEGDGVIEALSNIASSSSTPEQVLTESANTSAILEQVKQAGLDRVQDPYTKRALSGLDRMSAVEQARKEAQGITNARVAQHAQYVDTITNAQEAGEQVKIKRIGEQIAAPIGKRGERVLPKEARPQLEHLVPEGLSKKHFLSTSIEDVAQRVINDKQLQPQEIIGKSKRFLNTANTREFEAALKDITPEHADALMRYVKGSNNFSTWLRNNPNASITNLPTEQVQGMLTSVVSKLLEKKATK